MRPVFFKAARYEDKTMLFHEVLGLLRWQKRRFSELIGSIENAKEIIVRASEDKRALTDGETQYVLRILTNTAAILDTAVVNADEYLQYSAEPEEIPSSKVGDIDDESYRS